MARLVKLAGSCSYKKTALVICCVNIVVALYVLRVLYASVYTYANRDPRSVVRYTSAQNMKMEESIRIRKAAVPVKLVKLVKKANREFQREDLVVELPVPLKNKITEELLDRLQGLEEKASINEQREAVENWRKEKLQEFKQLSAGNSSQNSTIPEEEAGILVRALESHWNVLSEHMGLWIPTEIIHEEHDDKPENAEEDDENILPGRPVPPECHTELHTDYGGAAVRWGLTHHKESAADCCQACLDQAKRAKPGEMKCNIWVYCPAEEGCYSPDIYQHKNQECWLKYAKEPRLNFKDRYSQEYRMSHPNAPEIVPWVSGVVSV